jgi:hypothetical protein
MSSFNPEKGRSPGCDTTGQLHHSAAVRRQCQTHCSTTVVTGAFFGRSADVPRRLVSACHRSQSSSMCVHVGSGSDNAEWANTYNCWASHRVKLTAYSSEGAAGSPGISTAPIPAVQVGDSRSITSLQAKKRKACRVRLPAPPAKTLLNCLRYLWADSATALNRPFQV